MARVERVLRTAANITAIFLLSAVLDCAANAATDRADHKKSTAGDEIFLQTNVLRIQIEIAKEGIARLRKQQWGGGPARQTVQATIRESGRVYTNVAVHIKGTFG